MIMFGFILPTVLLLVWQFWLTYGSSDKSSIEFAPFGVLKVRSGWLDRKFLLSIFFPALVTILFLKDALKDNRMLLGWITLAFGASYTYFLAESGERFNHGNFTWSGEIAMIVMFCVSTIFFIERIKNNRWKTILVVLLWCLQVLFGIGYYLYVMQRGVYA